MAFRLSAIFLLSLTGALAQDSSYVGSKVCSECHAAIAASYALTAMAHASGPISDLHLPDGVIPAATAKATYSIKWQGGKPELGYRKTLPDGTLIEGSKLLRFYIGSGSHGRGFIFEEQGQPFQLPIAYFGQRRGWDVAPGYEKDTSLFLGRKVETACLACHTSGPKSIQSGLFDEGAVSCERCHGPGAAHAQAIRAGKTAAALAAIVNPAKLAPEQRDSICAQCHLTGETRVLKPQRSETSFRAGEALADSIVPFVWSNPDQTQFKVVGHFEGLWQSKCKRTSGDRLSCLTCHDPHVQTPASERDSFYRQKCLGCHQPSSCKSPLEARNQKADSCIACHMQQRASTDGQHTAFTDHSIRRVPEAPSEPNHPKQLTAFWPARATARDYALAEADLAWQHSDSTGFQKAHEQLKSVQRLSQFDAALAAQLAYTYDLAGDSAKAAALYEEALEADHENLLALTNLGTHFAREGKIDQAVDLWKRAMALNPGLEAPALNLARGEWHLGHRADAIATVKRSLSLNPDSSSGLQLLREMESQ